MDDNKSGQNSNNKKNEEAKDFTNLVAWQKAHKFAIAMYSETSRFPREELFGLTSQLRRSAVSVAANIAEGFRKFSKLEKIRFLSIAEGSLEESRYYLILAHDLKYIKTNNHTSALSEISSLLRAYRTAIHKSMNKEL